MLFFLNSIRFFFFLYDLRKKFIIKLFNFQVRMKKFFVDTAIYIYIYIYIYIVYVHIKKDTKLLKQ